ncbi:MAG: PTS system mannose/fructose/sorbose family transporter subunit IID [Gemmatimonadetes bacterium]|nr:PTS system mannose/fructose/sorbose family transporter subunit IID [Gemmatimonadota bacterium]
MSNGLPRAAVVSAFLRSFLIQGSWNYRSMLGGGFAFAMLPTLRRLFTEQPARQAALARHLELFNAHPYMSNMALGAAVKLEAEGADADTVRRFKLAVRGPLGSLGDGLVWATWLPGVSLLALTLYWMGAPGWVAAATFLVVYNVGHVGLRLWAFRVGLAHGREVGGRLAKADLAGWTERLQGVASMLLGGLVGAVLLGGDGLRAAGPVWVGVAAAAGAAGLLVGHRSWRPAAVTVVAAVVGLSALGWLS